MESTKKLGNKRTHFWILWKDKIEIEPYVEDKDCHVHYWAGEVWSISERGYIYDNTLVTCHVSWTNKLLRDIERKCDKLDIPVCYHRGEIFEHAF